MAKKAYRVRNWKDYNKSLVQRGSLTFWFSEEVIHEWQSCSKGAGTHGNQKYAEMVIICGLTIRQLFRLPLRATEGMMGSIARLMKLNVLVPNYSTLCRRGKTVKVDLKGKQTSQARHVLVDSTGIQVVGESEWKHFKYGVTRSKYQVWRKLHIDIDAANQDVLAATVMKSKGQFVKLQVMALTTKKAVVKQHIKEKRNLSFHLNITLVLSAINTKKTRHWQQETKPF
jgi:hypothetical protein